MPLEGAPEEAIAAEEAAVGRNFSFPYRDLLLRWNGINLEILRVFGCGATVKSQVRKMQIPSLRLKGLICIGSDPAGFLFCEDEHGAIFCYDTDGGRISDLAKDLDDFIDRLVFGPDAQLFAGAEWAQAIRNEGLL